MHFQMSSVHKLSEVVGGKDPLQDLQGGTTYSQEMHSRGRTVSQVRRENRG